MTDDPVARLKAGLDEDEAAAKAVTFRSHFEATGNSVKSPGGAGHPPMPIADVIDAETATHIGRQDPARVLRQVAAMREILEACTETLRGEDSRDYPTEGGTGEEYELARFALARLAAIYSDDEDVRR